MQTFLVERNIGAASAAMLFGISASSLRHAAEMRDEGERIYYLGSTYVPSDHRCLCLFEATDIGAVERLNVIASLSSTSIKPAVALAMAPVTVEGAVPRFRTAEG